MLVGCDGCVSGWVGGWISVVRPAYHSTNDDIDTYTHTPHTQSILEAAAAVGAAGGEEEAEELLELSGNHHGQHAHQPSSSSSVIAASSSGYYSHHQHHHHATTHHNGHNGHDNNGSSNGGAATPTAGSGGVPRGRLPAMLTAEAQASFVHWLRLHTQLRQDASIRNALRAVNKFLRAVRACVCAFLCGVYKS